MSGALNDAPLSAEAFAEALAPLRPLPSKIAIAVSGGPDSMALAFCLKRWGQGDFIALIVDHALRPTSAEEAEQTRKSLQQIGIPAEILRWDHGPIDSRLHQTARRARYDLLIEACKKHERTDLMLAHHRDDQAETILMRLAKGSGIEGLAGMAASTWHDNVRLLRPFLPFAKSRLIATCQQAGLNFITDASNNSSRFARGRLRQIMPLLEAEGLSVDTLLLLGERAGLAAAAIDYYTRHFLQQNAQAGLGGDIILDRGGFMALPQAVAMRSLHLCFNHIHDSVYAPEYASLLDLCLRCQHKGLESTNTLHGCLIALNPKTIQIMREPAAAAETLALQRGQTVLWDGRWLVDWKNDALGDRVIYRLAALGTPPHKLIDECAPDLRRTIAQGRVRASLPALWDRDRLCAIPSFDTQAPLSMAYRKQSFP